jgi:NAD-dependent SIR2 family protein deacetylase
VAAPVTDLQKGIEALADMMFASSKLVIFTGAGISTDSGISDFRGPDGVWTRRDKGLAPKPGGTDWGKGQPNTGHYAVAALQEMGKLDFLISQNIDNLHLKSGIKPEILAELHGNVDLLRCRRCDATIHKTAGSEKCDCGGSLKSSVVDFGDSLPQKDLLDSFQHARQCDLFIVIGSTLVVTPAANIPLEAVQNGADLVIVNKGETPLDRIATLLFDEKIGDVFPRAVAFLKKDKMDLG